MKKTWIVTALFMTAASMFAPINQREVQALTEINPSISVQPGMKIAVVSKTKKGQFWSMIRKGMEIGVTAINESYHFKKGDKIKMTFEGSDNELNVEDQINTIDAVLSENPDVLCLSAIDMESCQAQIEMAVENGIPVILFDSSVAEADLMTAFRATDHTELGREAAEELAEAMEGSGEILVFSAQEKTESIQNRINGFSEVLKNYPDITVDAVYYEDQVENMSETMQQALVEYPNAKGVFCTNGDISETYLGLPKELRENLLLVGVDASTMQQNAVRTGEEVSVISQDPCSIGYETVLTAVYAAMEDVYPEIELEKEILFAPQKINANNIYNPQYSNYLYEETK